MTTWLGKPLVDTGMCASVIGWAALGVVLLVTSAPASAEKDVMLEPPPRTITDITTILDQQKPDPEARERILNEVSVQPPETSDVKKLAKFYYKRGRTRSKQGYSFELLDDYRRAYQVRRALGSVR